MSIEESDQAQARELLNQFLASVEKRAYAMALTSVKDAEEALDIVQDTMFTLARKYADRPSEQWPPLFYRILKNRVTDFHRSNTVRRRIFGWLGRAKSDPDDTDQDIADQTPGPTSNHPDRSVQLDDATDRLQDALGRLPGRQREAFMLRCWEGLDVRDTAAAMGCSSGSVKTHYSRAVHALRAELEEYADV